MNDIEKLDYMKTEELQPEDIRQLIIAGLQQVEKGKTKDFNIVCDRLEEKYTKEVV